MGVISSGIYVKVESDNTSTSGKVREYDTYQDMLNESEDIAFAIVQDASADGTIVGDVAGPVVYKKEDTGWVKLYQHRDTVGPYTSFKVYANDEVIPVGEHPVLGTVRVEIPVGMTHKQQIRTMGKVEDSDIIVDWGDGSYSVPSDGDYDEYTAPYDEWNDSQITVSHTYAKPGSYTVKIFGKKYYGLRTVREENNVNLIYEAFSENCTLTDNVKNLSDFLRNAARLTKLSMSLGILKGVGNIYALCRNCVNLLSATGFPTLTGVAAGYIFMDCVNLKTTDFVVPSVSIQKTDGAQGRCFENCYNLESTVEALLPPGGFVSYRVNINRLFFGAKKLTLGNATNVSYLLFGNTHTKFCGSSNWKSNTAEVFAECSDELREQIPVAWGGTKIE